METKPSSDHCCHEPTTNPPPRSRGGWWLAFAALLIIGGALGLKNATGAAEVFWRLSDGGQWLLPLVGLTALVDSVNPCAFSILLLTIAFLLSIGRTRSGILKIGGVYIFGVFASYILIGLGLLRVLHLFNTPHFMGKLGAGLLILLGLINLAQNRWPNLPIKLRIPKVSHGLLSRVLARATLPAAFLLGILVGLCEFPCTGGPYLMILGLLNDHTTYLTGSAYLLLYNAIFILPLIIILALASRQSLLARIEVWQKREKGRLRLWGGLAMIILGLLVLLL